MTQSEYPHRHVAQIIFKDAQMLDIAGPMEVFSQADRMLSRRHGKPAYRLTLVAEYPGSVAMSSGICLAADSGFADAEDMDTLLIAGGKGVDKACACKELIRFVQGRAPLVRRTASVCTGTFILAEAGLLNGRQATTHWADTRLLADGYPGVKVMPDQIFVKDGPFYSSAGVTAGIDLALALVEEDHGRELALDIAKQLVVFMKRQGGQSQFSTDLIRQTAAHGRLHHTVEWITRHPCENLSVAALADRAAMSQRNFARTFKRETGHTPGKFVEKMRVELAARQIETLDAGFKEIALASGFKSEEMMRRAFKRQLNVRPKRYRKRFGPCPAA